MSTLSWADYFLQPLAINVTAAAAFAEILGDRNPSCPRHGRLVVWLCRSWHLRSREPRATVSTPPPHTGSKMLQPLRRERSMA